MSATFFLQIALPTPLRKIFDYLPPQGIDIKSLIVGTRVLVPFQSRKLIGILIAVAQKTDTPFEKLKQAYSILDHETIFPAEVYDLCKWAAEYYQYAHGEVLSTALPAWLRKGKVLPALNKKEVATLAFTSLHTLNDEQQHAVNHIVSALNLFKIFLLAGVTGSGKTEVYLQVIHHVLQKQQQVLVLVPEISLTPQTIERFRSRFNVEIAALHSDLSDKDRLRVWQMSRAGDAKIVIGTRSAIFTPFANLGLIIVDEEHDPSFKQQDRFRYHARDLATIRARMHQIPVVLGSATPSLESILNVKRKRYELLPLTQRAGSAALPCFEVIDLRKTKVESGLSDKLLQTMTEVLAENNQVMLFLNRRGFAPVLYCNQCAWIANCKRCDAKMVYHKVGQFLQCHYCDQKYHSLKHCQQCHAEDLQLLGMGTQRLEQTLSQYFPDVPLIRVDRDSTSKKGSLVTLLDQIQQQSKAILIGTQMLAKGHHFPNVTLVGIIDADGGLMSADFRASEQMGQLLLQTAGRAGRETKLGRVFIQTRYPDNVLLQTLLTQGYDAFADVLLKERKQTELPPFHYLAVLRAESYQENRVMEFLQTIKQQTALPKGVQIQGPMPAMLAKRKGLYCYHLLMKSDRRSLLQTVLTKLIEDIGSIAKNTSVKWTIDVDPMEV